ncbi:nucleotide exchange factor GrpE [Pontiella sulfatireligans]|uniref:Uncharacterized protein n=1 Tax=Pontiella sulfatireligans TaxID=2750658 RepID=A0A6C2UVJ9_9BACT|nr:nucleotide exchange factor GrpE [Pontiella sulfatireligans]VGO23137.1 hypothetical protein SCARR_05242 [Pontiella sulfatireligans]
MDKAVEEVAKDAEVAEVDEKNSTDVLGETQKEPPEDQKPVSSVNNEPAVDDDLNEQQPSNDLKEDLVGFFTRPMLSQKKTEELKKLVQDADAIHKRMDQLEVTVQEMGKASAQLQKKTGKALALIFKEIEKSQISHQRVVEQAIAELKSDFSLQTSSAKQFQAVALSKVDDAAGTIQGVNGSLSGIRGFLDENNQVVKRFEEGYDYQMLKNFVREIARTISNLDKCINNVSDEEAREELIDARDDMVELLERNSVDQIIPPVGDTYAGNEKYWEQAQDKEPNDDPARRGKVARVERAGYIYEFNNDQERVIQAARVVVFA